MVGGSHGKGGCIKCGGVLFDSENTSLCGDCLLKMRELFGVRIFHDGTVIYRIGRGRWAICEWKAVPRGGRPMKKAS